MVKLNATQKNAIATAQKVCSIGLADGRYRVESTSTVRLRLCGAGLAERFGGRTFLTTAGERLRAELVGVASEARA